MNIKTALFTLTLVIFFNMVFAQHDDNVIEKKVTPVKKEKVEIFRDRLIVDVFHSFWLGVPNKVNNNKLNPGFNVAALWDFKTKKKSPISFGLGLGCVFQTQFTDAQIRYDNVSNLTKYYLLPSTLQSKDSVKLNRVTYINANIPLEFRYRHKSGFKLTIGARLGLVCELSQRYKGNDITGDGVSDNYKYFIKENRQKINFDVYMRAGWKFAGIYFSYQVNKLFDEGKGPAINPISFGISLSLF